MLDTDIKKEFKMINAALERLDLKSGTMAFIVSVVVALFSFYEKDSSTEHSDINDKRLEDKIETVEYRLNVVEQGNQSIVVTRTMTERNTEDIKGINSMLVKIDDKIDKLIEAK